MLKKNIQVIVACQRSDWGIGKDCSIPWKSPEDLRYFKRITTETRDPQLANAVIMGNKTRESIGRDLPGRINYVVTRKKTCGDLGNVLADAGGNPMVEKIFVIGGADIYRQVLSGWAKYIEKIYITLIDLPKAVCCNKFFDFSLVKDRMVLVGSSKQRGSGEIQLEYLIYQTRNFEEEAYMEILKKILEVGESRDDRTGVGTCSSFGEKLVFDISERLPVLTSKRIFWKTVVRELLWFISGSTDAKKLQRQGVHIWDGNSSREFLDSRGLTDLPVGDVGASYGFQWRHFGAKYVDCTHDYTGQGVDQLAEVIRLIKTDPTSRRILMTAWNPMALDRTALPPCHVLAQFYVRDSNFLDCQLYQRSADMALGVPFNITSYSILTCMIAHVTGLKPGLFIYIIGDAHIYKNHIDKVKTQLDRIPYLFPRLIITREISDIDDFKESDLELIDYRCHPGIQFDMAV